MDDLLVKLFTDKAPPLLVLTGIVWMFLRHLRDQSEINRNMLKEMHDQHIQARSETQKALLENAASTRDNTKAIQSLENSVITIISKNNA